MKAWIYLESLGKRKIHRIKKAGDKDNALITSYSSGYYEPCYSLFFIINNHHVNR